MYFYALIKGILSSGGYLLWQKLKRHINKALQLYQMICIVIDEWQSPKDFLGTMFSLPDTWNFSIKGLASILPNGESSVKSSLRKLEELGYLKRERICDNKGKVVEWEYTFSDTPMFLEEGEKLRLERERKKAEKSLAEPTTPPEVENRHVDNPDIENPQVENQQVELPQVRKPS